MSVPKTSPRGPVEDRAKPLRALLLGVRHPRELAQQVAYMCRGSTDLRKKQDRLPGYVALMSADHTPVVWVCSTTVVLSHTILDGAGQSRLS